jgi:3-hydroxyacyl-CoA dehydrogenase
MSKRKDAATRSVIKTIAVIGANATGQDFARTAALAGYDTILEDISREMLERGVAKIREALDAAVARGELRAQDRDSALERITPVVGVEHAIRHADLLIEAVPEELEMKVELFTIFDKFAKPGAIFASSTRTLSILDVSDVTVYRERCVGLRYRVAREPSSPFGDEAHPAAVLHPAAIEVVCSKLTAPEVIDACKFVAERLSNEVHVISDVASTF